ncbi:hypothetical protein RB608_01640 [Nocardioides sp. LHD-245]|uniref:hypothetical protein n=1 Tax=Nocardioides sp. LHD-245 TaxID=3051387 RepID=UPI0027E0053D|nr:hypothetical protein [Nocardioides sp. LHD-245]
MRTQLLGLTAAALAAGTLSLGVATPAQAVGGIDGGNISGSGDVPNSVDVAAFGSGDAVAAWAREVPGGTKVYAAIATDGVWGAAKAVTAAAVTDAHDVRVAANDAGDLAVVWNQTTGGEHKVRGSRYLPNGSWDGSTLLSPAVDVETVEWIDAAIDGAGRVHLAYEAENDGAHRVSATMWAKGGTPQFTTFGAHTFRPSIDANPAGDVLMSYFTDDDGDQVMVTRRNASVGWLGPKPVLWNGDLSEETVARLADDGRGAVLVGGWEDAGARAVVTRVDAAGGLGGGELVSPIGVGTAFRDLSVSPNGTMQVTWTAFENGTTYVIRSAVAKPNQTFGGAGVAEPKTVTNQRHLNLVSDRTAQVIVHNDAEKLTLRHRTNPVFLFNEYDAGATDGPFAADMDREGNVVAAGIVENGFSSYVEADFLDVAGPIAQVTAPGTSVSSPGFDVAWNVTDSLSGVKSSDVMVRSAAWNGGFGGQQVMANNTTTTAQAFAGTFGSTYCFEVQGVDMAGNLGFRSGERCTTVPLDDTALTGKKWKRIAQAGAFNDTATTAKKKGRKLALSGIQAKHLSLMVTKAKKGGKIKVTWNGTLLKKISLKGTGRATVALADFAGVQGGTLKIKVISKNGRKVTIDGLVAAK